MNQAVATRVAILADIHGNLAALEAVLADVVVQSPDLLVLAGDLVMGGPYPAETLARIIALGVPAVIGNTDQDVIEGTGLSSQWTHQRLGSREVDYLRSLPLAWRVTPPNGNTPLDDLLIVHSTPRHCNDVLILAIHPLTTTFTQTTPIEDAIPMLDGAQANLILYGHIHYVSEGVIAGQRVMSIGAVGFPFDGDHRAAYALAAWDGATWEVTQHRVAYDYERVARILEQLDHPLGARQSAMLRAANWLPRPSR